jgi:hypothetical protein
MAHSPVRKGGLMPNGGSMAIEMADEVVRVGPFPLVEPLGEKRTVAVRGRC